MNDYIEVVAIVEGPTESIFIKNILAPYFANKNIFINPIIISKPGQKGGDVRFVRVINDIKRYLKQRQDTYVTLFVDYYGIGSDWPGINSVNNSLSPIEIAKYINEATQKEIDKNFDNLKSNSRFISNITIYEFEALLFSDVNKLADQINVNKTEIDKIIEECGEPEKINTSVETAPSKRLEKIYRRYKKTTTGIAIAKDIGIDKMREQCPNFNLWLEKLEKLIVKTN